MFPSALISCRQYICVPVYQAIHSTPFPPVNTHLHGSSSEIKIPLFMFPLILNFTLKLRPLSSFRPFHYDVLQIPMIGLGLFFLLPSVYMSWEELKPPFHILENLTPNWLLKFLSTIESHSFDIGKWTSIGSASSTIQGPPAPPKQLFGLIDSLQPRLRPSWIVRFLAELLAPIIVSSQ